MIAVAIAAAAFVLARPERGPSVTVPLLVGQTRVEAQRRRARGEPADPRTPYRASDDPHGTVIRQDPAPGSFLAERSTVHVVLSSGPDPVGLPELAGLPVADATAALQDQFAVEVVSEATTTSRRR